LNLIIVIKIAIQRIIISIRATRGKWSPKKIIDQIKFKKSWIEKNARAILIFLFLKPFFQTKKAETPIKKYKVVHTGPKTQFGGAKKGLLRIAYQPGIEASVKGVLIRPTVSQVTMEINNLNKSLILFLIKQYQKLPYSFKNYLH